MAAKSCDDAGATGDGVEVDHGTAAYRARTLLTIVMIDDEHIDAIVTGDFGEGCPDEMLDRLGRLARCPTRTQ